ncbi:ACT domain-containing protein [Altererythrobacter aurantiacus]|uniref:ACT domain-containing protein n=1 Tax=Parapontixanthobacter aurantiacus TaxID=1463599 RepID=A0A844ZB96_9SPHN|nr:ACT domain-containing protein [Parapontixanthobacter aurantiacus]MXO84466.1 ACT domain-containing protein [Parapontixanthobacter aurantiacus]
MIAEMAPVLSRTHYVFAETKDDRLLTRAFDQAFAVIREDEATTLVLPIVGAGKLGIDTKELVEFARIILSVHSDLEGVGLTAAVSTELARCGIACNVIAASRHDHIFVPACAAEEAVERLEQLAKDWGRD